MAKILIAGKAPEKLNVNLPPSGFIKTDKLAVKQVQVGDVPTSEPFISLFKIKETVLNAITENMKNIGYDENHPIIIWKEGNVLIDGHTRLQAAKNAGIKTLPAFYASFDTEEDVMDYMYRVQFHRRNINDSDLLRLITEALPKHEKKYGEGSKAEFLAQKFTGLSLGKAKQAIIVAEKGSSNDFQKIHDGEATIRQVYNKLKDEKKDKTEKVTRNFFDDGNRKIIRCDDNGNFYFRNYSKMKEVKAFALPKFMNSETLRKRIMAVIEEEMGRHDNE